MSDTPNTPDLPAYEIPSQFAGMDDDGPAPILVREWKRLLHDANWWMQNAVSHKQDADTSRGHRDQMVVWCRAGEVESDNLRAELERMRQALSEAHSAISDTAEILRYDQQVDRADELSVACRVIRVGLGWPKDGPHDSSALPIRAASSETEGSACPKCGGCMQFALAANCLVCDCCFHRAVRAEPNAQEGNA